VTGIWKSCRDFSRREKTENVFSVEEAGKFGENSCFIGFIGFIGLKICC